MPIPNKVKQRIVTSFGDPSLTLKVYDELQDDISIQQLQQHLQTRNANNLAFIGVAHLIHFADYGSLADLQLYGRVRPENPEEVYPLSIILSNGQDLPSTLGRACLEETILFGKEAELYLKLKDQGHEQQLKMWLEQFAL